MSREAFRLILENLPRALQRPDDLEARGGMLEAAAFAGLAIENSMLGAAHSMANPLTAHFGIDHGQAVGMALPGVVAFNAADPSAATSYAELARGAQLCAGGASDAEGVAALIIRIEMLLVAAGFPPSLQACGVPADAVDSLATEAARQWTAQFNPRPVGEAEFRTLFTAALA
jgi:alcohol dehydrogenase